jgi:hypothetical protein
MNTFADDILAETSGRPILAISLGSNRGGYSWDNSGPDHPLGSDPVSWAEALPYISYEYDSGFGGQDCHNFLAWTETHVLSIHEYDGSTCVISVPRNPLP